MDPASDGHRSRASIDAFLATLSPWNLIYVRSQATSGAYPIIGLATFSDMPAELICIVGSYLPLTDVLRCRRVSQAWRAAWTHDAVVAFLCRDLFPGLLETSPGQDQQSLFLRAAEKRLRRHFGRPPRTTIPWDAAPSTKHFHHESPYNGSGLIEDSKNINMKGSSIVFYSHGKVIWQPDPSQVIIDDLSTRHRHKCTFGSLTRSGKRLDLINASEKMLVLQDTTSPESTARLTLHVWHIQKTEWKRISTPSPVLAAFIQEETVALRTSSGNAIIVWTWGGKAVQLEDYDPTLHNSTPDEDQLLLRESKIIFHPTNSNVLFKVWAYSEDSDNELFNDWSYHSFRPGRLLIAIMKYENTKMAWPAGEHLKYSTRTGCGNQDRCLCPMGYVLPCEKANERGLHQLVTILPVSFSDDELGGDCNCDMEWTSLFFNTATETFGHSDYRLCGPARLLEDRTYACHTSREDELIVGWHHFQNISSFEDHRMIGQPVGHRKQSRGWRYRRGWPEEYSADQRPGDSSNIYGTYAESHEYDEDGAPLGIFSDDDFVVVVEAGFMHVWSFAEDESSDPEEHRSSDTEADTDEENTDEADTSSDQ